MIIIDDWYGSPEAAATIPDGTNTEIDLPRGVRESLPTNAQGVWADAYKMAVDLGDGSEETRVQAAWDAVKAQGWLKEDTGRWRKTDKRLLRGGARSAIAMMHMAIAMAKASGGWSKQPRVNNGPKGGQWTTGGTGASSMSGGSFGALQTVAPGGQAFADRNITAPHLGQGGFAAQRFEADPSQAVFVAPLKQTEITGLPAFLDNPHGYVLMQPSTASNVADNGNPEDTATYIPDGDPGKGLNGIAFKPWDPPEDWSKVQGQGKFDEPDIPDAKGKRLGAGVIIEEPDGRIWTVNPLNAFGGYKETFPKGGIEPGLDLRQTAIKEALEESGLKVELTGYLGDFERTTSVARYYRARRVTGDPTDAHWETQAVNAVPLDELADRVVHHADAPIIASLMGESVSVQKALCVLADLIDADDINASPEDMLSVSLAKAKGKGGGSWKKQMRVPAGLPTGGQWTTYGSGGIGSAYAAGGVALELQKHMGTGSQSEKLNATIQLYQNAANQGYLHPDAKKVLSGPKSGQTYSSAKYESAAEAKAYTDAYGMDPNIGKSPDAVQPTGHYSNVPVETMTAPKNFLVSPTGQNFGTSKGDGIATHETFDSKLTSQIAHMEATGWSSVTHTVAEAQNKGAVAAASAKLAVQNNLDVYMVNVGLAGAKTGVGAAGWDAGTAQGWKAEYEANGGYHFTPDGQAYTSFGKPKTAPNKFVEDSPVIPDVVGMLKPVTAADIATHQAAAAPKAPAKFVHAGTLSDPMKLSDMPKTGDKVGGTAAGGIHTDATGQKWLVKSYNTALQAQNEVAASKIYNSLGVHTPQMKLVDLGGEYKGGIGVASKYLDDVVPFDVGNPSHVSAVQANFGAHALLADWDAVGASFDNVMISKTSGAAILVDPGGSMLFRAQGTPKGDDFKDSVGELNSMRDPSVNHTGAKVFGPMTESAISASALEAGFGFTDNVNGIAKIIDDHMPLAEGNKLKTKLVKRAVDIANQGQQLQANLVSTASVGIAKTGTTTPSPTHSDPHVAAVAAMTGPDAQKHIDDLNSQMAVAQMSLSGESAVINFYSNKMNDLNQIANTGDVAAVHAALYVPNHAKKGGGKYSPNYTAYLKAHAAAVKKAEAVAGKQLKNAPEAHAGSMVTGTAKITPAQVASAKTSGETSKMADPLSPSVAMGIEPTPTPKPVTPQILVPAPPLPSKPFIVSSDANPNTKLIGLNDAVEKINNDPGLGPNVKIAQLNAIAKQLPAVGNTYSKKVKAYVANSIAAHGGMHALDTMPHPEKTAAMNEGLAKGNEAMGVAKPGVVVETKVEDLGGGYVLTSQVETTTTHHAPIDPNAPFDVASLPVPPDFFNYKGPGIPLYNTNPEFNAINNTAVQAMYAAAKIGKTELDKIDPGTSNKLIEYKTALLSAINNHASDLKAKMAAWKPVTTETKTIGEPHLAHGSGQPAKPHTLISAITATMSKPKNWLVPAAEKIGHFVKVGSIDPKHAVALHDAMPMSQMFLGDAMAKKMTKDVLALPMESQKAMAAHTSANESGFGYWQSENQALYDDNAGPTNPHFASGMKKAKAITKGVELLPDLPVGFTFTRKMFFSGAQNTPEFWNKQAGVVLNNPGISSSAIDGAWSGNVVFVMKAAEGVKAAYLAETHLGLGQSEKEILLPRNYKMVVVRATPFNEALKTNEYLKTAKAKAGHGKLSEGSSKTVVEVILVPHDKPE